jgi:hypothetical protein
MMRRGPVRVGEVTEMTTDKFKIQKEMRKSQLKGKIFPIFTIRGKNGAHLTQQMVKDLVAKYNATGKKYTVRAVTSHRANITIKDKEGEREEKREIHRVLKNKDTNTMAEWTDDYYKSKAGPNRGRADETYEYITITVEGDIDVDEDGGASKKKKKKQTF